MPAVSQLTHLLLILKRRMQHLQKALWTNCILSGKDSCLELDTKELRDPVQATTAQLKYRKLMLKLLLMQEHRREKQKPSTTLPLINGIIFDFNRKIFSYKRHLNSIL